MRLSPLLLLGLLLAGPAAADEPAVLEGAAEVVDGGTLAVDGTTLRLFGIVAPGPRQKCRDGSLPWLCGAAARDHLRKLIDGRTVRCQVMRPGIAECRAGGHDLSGAMVHDGWAVAEKDAEIFVDLEEEARAAKRGLWERSP